MKRIKNYPAALSIIALLLFPMSISAQRTALQPQASQERAAKFKKVTNAIPNSYIVVLNDNAVGRTATADARRSQVSAIADNLAQLHVAKWDSFMKPR